MGKSVFRMKTLGSDTYDYRKNDLLQCSRLPGMEPCHPRYQVWLSSNRNLSISSIYHSKRNPCTQHRTNTVPRLKIPVNPPPHRVSRWHLNSCRFAPETWFNKTAKRFVQQHRKSWEHKLQMCWRTDCLLILAVALFVWIHSLKYNEHPKQNNS
jgi:hypothetical protein